jgi:class 3 adenylate cyclase
MADVESSSPLARRLSTAQYFAFGRRLVRAIDQTVIGASGIVGRHTGDGVVAFFVADATSSESAAARSCITVARSLRDTLADIAIRSEIPASEVSLRFGLHWGATLYMGRILTTGRSEVTALGDEVNEAARIEACATGSRILASKSLVERLDQADATALGLDTGHTSYTLLADLATATDKARRDAPSIAVCELSSRAESPAERWSGDIGARLGVPVRASTFVRLPGPETWKSHEDQVVLWRRSTSARLGAVPSRRERVPGPAFGGRR